MTGDENVFSVCSTLAEAWRNSLHCLLSLKPLFSPPNVRAFCVLPSCLGCQWQKQLLSLFLFVFCLSSFFILASKWAKAGQIILMRHCCCLKEGKALKVMDSTNQWHLRTSKWHQSLSPGNAQLCGLVQSLAVKVCEGRKAGRWSLVCASRLDGHFIFKLK